MVGLPIECYLGAVVLLSRVGLIAASARAPVSALAREDDCLTDAAVLHAMVCLLLAAKAEDVRKPIFSFVAAFFELRRAGGWQALECDESYLSLQELVVAREQLLLRRLAFDVRPAGEMGSALHTLAHLCAGLGAPPSALPLATAILADVAFPAALFTRHSVPEVLGGCLWLAHSLCAAPSDDDDGRHWWRDGLGIEDRTLISVVDALRSSWTARV
jgi:hypothetical protein